MQIEDKGNIDEIGKETARKREKIFELKNLKIVIHCVGRSYLTDTCKQHVTFHQVYSFLSFCEAPGHTLGPDA